MDHQRTRQALGGQGCGGCGSAKPCCVSQVVTLLSAAQAVIPYQYPSHRSRPPVFLTPHVTPISKGPGPGDAVSAAKGKDGK
jgi:hypothetical protein